LSPQPAPRPTSGAPPSSCAWRGPPAPSRRPFFAVTRNLVIVNGTVAAFIVAYAYLIALPSPDLIRLALTALLATIPVALPATFTLSAAFGAQTLAKCGVLLTRLSAAHEAAAMDVLCADKTGTLTRNELEVIEVEALPGCDRGQVLALAALASSEAEQDPIDAAIRAAAAQAAGGGAPERLMRFVPFDPAAKTAEAFAVDREGRELRIVKGAFEVIARVAAVPADARRRVDQLAEQGHRVTRWRQGRWTRCVWSAWSPSVIRRARTPPA
jgi:H+-transporting ATPase